MCEVHHGSRIPCFQLSLLFLGTATFHFGVNFTRQNVSFAGTMRQAGSVDDLWPFHQPPSAAALPASFTQPLRARARSRNGQSSERSHFRAGIVSQIVRAASPPVADICALLLPPSTKRRPWPILR